MIWLIVGHQMCVLLLMLLTKWLQPVLGIGCTQWLLSMTGMFMGEQSPDVPWIKASVSVMAGLSDPDFTGYLNLYIPPVTHPIILQSS